MSKKEVIILIKQWWGKERKRIGVADCRQTYFRRCGRAWGTKSSPNFIRRRNLFPTRKTASFKAFSRWNESVYSCSNLIENLFSMKRVDFVDTLKRIGVAFFLGFLLTTMVFIVDTAGYATRVQSGIAQKVVRFHVLANSDTEEDQWLKLQVRNRVLQEVGGALEQISQLEECKAYLAQNLERIQGIAEEEMEKLGYAYKAKVTLEKTQFPLKTYGGLTFPAGVYDALRIEIGQGEGQNWWCVMYPSMCFVDAACGEVEPTSKTKLKKTLTKEEYEVVSAREQKKITPKMKLKVVELWQDRKTQK